MAQKNTGTHDLQYHGLVTITPDSAAKDVIDKLNGTQLNDKHIVIREYKNREYVADQKALDELNTQHQGDRRHQYSESYLVSKLKL